jgi:hypothetical protein
VNRPLGGRVLLLGAIVGVAVAGHSDAARPVTPPPGTPDLAQMAIRASDLPGARVARQSYVKPDKSSVASSSASSRSSPSRSDRSGCLASKAT